MNKQCRVVIDLQNYLNSEDKAEAEATLSRNLTAEEQREAAIELMADPMVMWESLGPDAIPQPYSAPGEFSKRQNLEYEDNFNAEIHRLLIQKDFTALGKALHDMAVAHQIKSNGLDEVRTRAF